MKKSIAVPAWPAPRSPAARPTRPMSPAAAGRSAPAGCRSPPPQAPDRHLRLRRRPGWTRPSPGRQFLQLRQRHLGANDADPGRQVELRHVHHARRSVARTDPRESSRRRPRTPTARSASPTTSYLDEAAIEAKGLAPFEPWLNEVRGCRARPAIPPLMAAPTGSASAVRSPASSTRTTSRTTSTS